MMLPLLGCLGAEAAVLFVTGLSAAFMNPLCHHETCASRVISEIYEANEYSLTGTRRAQAPESILSSYKSVS